jgi:uncharacterized protein (TIGR02453 family)
MIQKSTIEFLKDLKLNNHKGWFDANRKMYEAAKTDYLQLVSNVLKGLVANDESLALLQPKGCTFRINRDVRFSKNKDPYKTNLGAGFSKGGKKMMLAGYYFHCEPGASFIAGGMWMPMAPELKKVRQEIDYCLDEFKEIVTNKAFVKTFGGLEYGEDVLLKRAPKGYEEDNPAINYLKLKSFIVSTPISDADLTSPKLVQQIVDACAQIQPLVYFINRGIEG